MYNPLPSDPRLSQNLTDYMRFFKRYLDMNLVILYIIMCIYKIIINGDAKQKRRSEFAPVKTLPIKL